MQSQGERVSAFIETFCTLGGSFLGQPVKLMPFQRDIIQRVYATDEDDYVRRALLLGAHR